MEGESSQPLHRGVDNTGSGPSASSIRLRSRPDSFLILCRCFSLITSLAAILCVAVNVLSAVRSFKNGSDIFDGIFRCYAVVIAIFVVVAETEWGFIIKFWEGPRVLGLEGYAPDIRCGDDQGLPRVLCEASGALSSSEHSQLPASCMWEYYALVFLSVLARRKNLLGIKQLRISRIWSAVQKSSSHC